MDAGVRRIANWWGTLIIGLALVFVGTFGYIMISGELGWYRTEVSGAREAMSRDMGEYVRVEGRVALNASRDVIIVQREVEKAIWTTEEYEYMVDWVWVEDDRGEPVLVLFDHVSETKPGRHGGDYHKGDEVCIGGTVALEGTGIKRLRADFVAKYPEDSPARYAGALVALMMAGMMLVLTFALARLFLHPRREDAPDWRGT